jgi:hypothetical protein
MAETITITRARIMDRNLLGIIALNSTTKSGLPRADMSKITITASGGPVTVAPVSTLLSLAGTADTAWFTYPQYATQGGDSNVLKQWLPLSRDIKQSETVTITFAAGYFEDDTNTSAAATDFVAEPLTFLDDTGEVSVEAFRRVGCGRRPKVDPATLSPVLRIKASDFAADGDGNLITARAATVGGTITPSGSVRYRADGVAGGFINGSTGAPVIEIPTGATLTSTVQLGSATADYTVLVVCAFAGNTGFVDVTGARVRVSATSGGQQRTVTQVGGYTVGFEFGGSYDLAASGRARLGVFGGGYEHAGTLCRFFGYGGSIVHQQVRTTTNDHTVAITITAGNSACYVSEVIVVPSFQSTENARGLGAYLDDEYNTTNRVFFVDPSAGNDANDGLTSAAPRLTLPNMNTSSANYTLYGAGDVIAVKRGTVTADTSISNRPLFSSAFGYSSQFPGAIGVYGPRSDGYWELQGQNAAVSTTIHAQNPHFVIFGMRVNAENRNPLNATHYDGFTTAKAIASGQFWGQMQTANIATHLGDPSLDPPMQQFIDCESRYAKSKCFLDSNSFYSGENWFAVSNSVMERNWDDTLSGALAAAGPSVNFFASTSMALLSRNVCREGGACWLEPASIGDHVAGARVFTAEASATYAAGPGTTTVTLASAFTNYVPGGSNARGIVRVKRTSNATEILAEIQSKTSNDVIVLRGNPFGIADAATITDVLLHGGLPAAPDGRNHFFYNSTGSPGGHLSYENVIGSVADHGFQHRSGGWVVDNVIDDVAIGGFVGDVGTGVIDGNLVERGHRTYSQVSSGPRVWGFSLLNAGDFYFAQNNIMNLSPTGFGSDVVANQSGGSFAFEMVQQGAAAARPYVIRNNTVTKLVGSGIISSGNTDLSTKLIERNIVQGDATYGPGVTLTDAGSKTLGTFTRNAYYSPDGAGADRFSDNSETFAEWQTATGSVGEIFSETTFSPGAVPISLAAKYYSTLPGGSENTEAWIEAVLAQKRANTFLSTLSAAPTLAYAREYLEPTNRTLVEGDGILMGAVGLGTPPSTPTPHSIRSARDIRRIRRIR